VSPDLAKQGCLRSGSNIEVGEVPIIFHPPGLWFGYMPVCLPPIPTAPLQTFNVGDFLRGWYNLVSNPTK